MDEIKEIFSAKVQEQATLQHQYEDTQILLQEKRFEIEDFEEKVEELIE